MPSSGNALSERVQAENWKTFQTWLKSNRKSLAPETGLGVIYAGQKIVGKVLPSGIIVGGRMRPDPKPMWKFIKEWNDLHKKVHGKLRYDTVEDVLRRLKPPRIKWTQGKGLGVIKVMTNMYDCANDLSSEKEQMLGKPERKKVWPELSRIYVSNIRGELAILEGVLKNFQRLDGTKIMIRDEIPVLLKNEELDADSKAELVKLHKSYAHVYEAHKKLGKQIIVMQKHLKAGK